MKNVPASILTLVTGVVVTLLSLWVGKNVHLLPEQVSEQAPLVDNLFSVMLTIGTAIFIIVEGALLLFMIQFRQKPGDESDGSPVEGNIPLEIVWTAIPSVIVIGLGIYSVEVYAEMGGFTPEGGTMMAHHHGGGSHDNVAMGSAIAAPLDGSEVYTAPALGDDFPEAELQVARSYGLGAKPGMEGESPDITIDVTGMQFAWLFNYPAEGVYSAEMHIPVGKTVHLNLEATDVIHAFWLPQFRIKQDVIPGEKTELQFTATKTGQYPIVCAELCGSYHGGMRADLFVDSDEDYAAWVQENAIAQHGNLPTVAINPAERSNSEFLAPYSQDWDVDAEVLQQLDHHHHSGMSYAL